MDNPAAFQLALIATMLCQVEIANRAHYPPPPRRLHPEMFLDDALTLVTKAELYLKART